MTATEGLGATTTLVEIVRQLDDIDGDLTIYMRHPWSATAECIVAPVDEDEKPPAAVLAAGFAYFLEIDVALEVLEVFATTPDKPPTEDEKVRAILYYAENDAWPEWVYER